MSWNGKGSGHRGLDAPTLTAPCAVCAPDEVERRLAMTRYVAVVLAEQGDTGGLGERGSGGCAIGADPSQSAHSSVELRPGQVRVRGRSGWMSPVQVWTLRRGA